MTNMGRIQTIITAAGDSRPVFKTAGFDLPKSLVTRRGKSVLSRAIGSYGIDLEATTVAVNEQEDDEWQVGDRIKRDFPHIAVARVSSGVKGALATALIALADIDECPLVVAAGDSTVAGGITGFVGDFFARGLSAATVAFESSSPRWSYLQVNGRGRVGQVAEKAVIGPLATTGVFYFASSRQFLEAATWVMVNNASHLGQFYVSTTLNYLIAKDLPVGYSVIPRDRYRSWSLPADFIDDMEEEGYEG